jgi:hypothetical protein
LLCRLGAPGREDAIQFDVGVGPGLGNHSLVIERSYGIEQRRRRLDGGMPALTGQRGDLVEDGALLGVRAQINVVELAPTGAQHLQHGVPAVQELAI